MTTIAFVLSGLRGHLYQCTPLIEALHDRGHELSLLLRDPDEHSIQLLSKYGPVEPVTEGELTAPPGSKKLSTWEGRVSRFRGLYIEHERVAVTKAFIERVQPEVVVGDGTLWCTIAAAELAQVPFVSLHSSLGVLAPENVDCERLRIGNALKDEQRAMFARHGASPGTFHRFEAISAYQNIFWAAPEIMHPDGSCPPNSVLAGASIERSPRGGEQAPWDELRERPTVYVSFGTVYHARALLLQKIIEGLAELDVNVVLAAPQLPEMFQSNLPANCVWLKHADQVQALRESDVFITHGGHSSFVESMCVGIPLLVVPLASDQPVQAFFADYAGIGRYIRPEELTPERVREDIGAILGSEDIRQRVTMLSKAYNERGGAAYAAECIEAKLASHKG